MNIGYFLAKNKPVLLGIGACVGIGGAVASSFMFGRKWEKHKQENPDDGVIKTIKKLWPYALSTAVLTGSSICLCAKSFTFATEREHALIDILEKSGNPAIGAAVGSAAGELLKSDISTDELKDDEELFYESISKTWFKSTMRDVERAEYHFNRNYAIKGWVTLDELYAFYGMGKLEDDVYKYYGWCTDMEVDDGYSWIDFTHVPKETIDGQKYYVIEYDFGPKYIFSNYE